MKENVTYNQEKIQPLEADPQSDPDIGIGREGLLNQYYKCVKGKIYKTGENIWNLNNKN